MTTQQTTQTPTFPDTRGASDPRRGRARTDVVGTLEDLHAEQAHFEAELRAARARFDAALLAALDDHGVRGRELQGILGVSHATFWRRVRSAREATSR
jgi:transcriptional regulator of acetoin/glycerol metabolism